MTEDELKALVELLNRCPMTIAERMWVQGIISREMQKLAAAGESEPNDREC